MIRLFIALLLAAPPAWASHEDFGFGARSSAMGDAMTAAGDDPGAVVYNPALASGITTQEIMLGARRASLAPVGPVRHDQVEVAAATPLNSFPWRGAISLHGWATKIDAMPLGSAMDPALPGNFPNPTNDPTFDGAHPGLFQPSLDRSLGLTYATHGWRETDNGIVDLGVTLKALTRAGRALNGSVAKAGVDIGMIYRIRERYALAFSAINVNGPRTDIGGLPDRAPVMVRLGVAQNTRGFTMALDAVKREGSQGRQAGYSVGAGLERWVHTGRIGTVALRAGLNMGRASKAGSLGVGWRALGAQVDYAALAPIESGSRWGHAVSLVFRFGSWDPDREFERLLGSEIRYRQELAHALDTAEVKQWKLAEELRRLRRSLEDLQAELNTRAQGEADAQQRYRAAKEKIRDLEIKEQEAQRSLEALEKDRKVIVEQSKEVLFREDWRAYQKQKLQGIPDIVLLERVKQLLRQYKDTGADLSEANQELRRLLLNLQNPQ
ncbi:MAG: hypothetical protein HY925_08830 [Elusimicrobia bacterium]|nr:hypothetical protein [Elusimicrobiota bacterium]